MSPFLKIASSCSPPGHKAFKIKVFFKKQVMLSPTTHYHHPPPPPGLFHRQMPGSELLLAPGPCWEGGLQGPRPAGSARGGRRPPYGWRLRREARPRVLCCPLLAASTASPSPASAVVFLYFFALTAEEGFHISPCYSLGLCIQMGISLLFSFAFHFSFHSYV